MLLKCSLLALAALAVTVCRAASIDTADQDQDSTFSTVQETKTVISKEITNKIPYMPPMMIIGNNNGSITRCLVAEPNSCEVYYSSDSTVDVTAAVVHGEYMYASLASGTMLRCLWQKRYSCYEFNQASDKIVGLAVAAGFIHAGLQNGTILRCQLDTPHSCWNYADVHRNIRSLAAVNSFLYAGSANGRIDRCSLTSQQGCSKVYETGGSEITGMVRLKEKIYALRSGGCIQYANIEYNQYTDYGFSYAGYTSMALLNQKIYLVRKSHGIYTNNPGLTNLELHANYENAVSISFAYATFGMQNKYRMEPQKCIWKGFYTCPPTVVYYDVHRRAQWEVAVKNGRLYDSQGVLLDTSDADESHSQKAAIFVMGPDGQLLVSKVHKRGDRHTSSLLAGRPVAGAGLMVVEQGRIRNITACSVHYRPTVDLNDQVKESLNIKGYTDNIDSYPCTYNGVLCNLDDNDVNNIS